MSLIVKLKVLEKLVEDGFFSQYLNFIKESDENEFKLTTKKLEIILDNRDERELKEIKNVELISNTNLGVFILYCHIRCSFVKPFGAEIFVYRYRLIKDLDYNTIKGVKQNIAINNLNPSSIEEARMFLTRLSKSNKFEFNIGQFSEFMEVFDFYKTLYNEINNNDNYKIESISKPLKFISIENKEIFDNNNKLLDKFNEFKPFYDNSKTIIGYLIPENVFDRLNNELKNNVLNILGIKVLDNNKIYNKLTKQKDNLFVSNLELIDNINNKNIMEIEVINILEEEKHLTIYIISKEELNYKYINLYDRGQQIKIESINNSLKLINQGNSGSAIELIEYLIGDSQIPNYHDNLIVNDEVLSYTKELNNSQKQAFLKAIDGSPITLIKGPPGTGKTHVINSIVQYITKELKQKVIISSQTHVAIDNVLDKLVQNKDPIIPKRITNKINKYSEEMIDKTLYRTWGLNLLKWLNETNDKLLANKIIKDIKKYKGEEVINFTINNNNDYFVTGATTTTTAISGKKGLELFECYDWLIIDEVSKCPITEVLRYLPYVNKIILVGDDYQLAPLLEFSKDQVKHLSSYDEDMFDKLEKTYKESIFSKTILKAKQSERLVLLNENYRSTPQIFNSYNVFYDNELIGRRNGIEDKKVYFDNNKNIDLNNKDIFFIDSLNATDTSLPGSTSRINVQECKSIAIILKEIYKSCLNKKEVSLCIIFSYKDQLKKFIKENNKLINEVKKSFKNFEIDTVDAFQGRETDIVLVSTVVVDVTKKSFLVDFRRINVALSRARDKLFIFGSTNLKKLEMKSPNNSKRKYLNEIISYIEDKGLKIKITTEGEILNDTRDSEIRITKS
ncbi:hypothetical protein SGLAD_v1c06220 [Spiroplasma gladiatoris]|uniref:AAA+ ATPase domain-containing protein n=1 Tax=Spiroplasma gladiatoris TaxID=2143 RepID=A0A4P7AI33_9MOLU|nr:AAA domain-containing protein [Spiroplasma gladiatoris]QBQ07821.1 hypothetical protein SGLAD_v1c06220 [Spiroplasma gladiatoris]